MRHTTSSVWAPWVTICQHILSSKISVMIWYHSVTKLINFCHQKFRWQISMTKIFLSQKIRAKISITKQHFHIYMTTANPSLCLHNDSKKAYAKYYLFIVSLKMIIWIIISLSSFILSIMWDIRSWIRGGGDFSMQ